MAGPVYLNENNKHSFDVIDKHLASLKEVHGPIYVTENAQHSFSEIQNRIKTTREETEVSIYRETWKLRM